MKKRDVEIMLQSVELLIKSDTHTLKEYEILRLRNKIDEFRNLMDEIYAGKRD